MCWTQPYTRHGRRQTNQNSTKKTCPISTEENNDRVGNSVNQASCQSDISELDKLIQN
jgi:hypothetical protein